MAILIYSLPAKTGDCFIIEIDEKVHILIDAGFSSTYRKYLKPKLLALKKQGKSIDLFVITHIDRDHIGGAITFLTENGYHNSPSIIPIKEIWFNGLMELCPFMDGQVVLSQQDIKTLQNTVIKQMIQSSEHCERTISVSEAISFGQLCKNFGYSFNTSFGGSAIIEKEAAWVSPEYNLSIDVASPSKLNLDQLVKYIYLELYKVLGKRAKFFPNESMRYIYECMLINHDEDLRTITQSIMDTSYTDLSQWFDSNQGRNASMSIPNLSSIALVIHYKDKVLVFPGDADTSFIVDKNIKPRLIKLSHHGSYQYNKKLINSNFECTYMLSTNSEKFGHPSLSLISNLLMAKGKKHLHMNYSIDKLSLLYREEQQQKYNFTVSCGDTLLLE